MDEKTQNQMINLLAAIENKLSAILNALKDEKKGKQMHLEIIGWIWLGILIGSLAGFFICSMMTSSRNAELEAEITHHIFVRDSLKEEIFRLHNQTKPKPRKRRNLKVKSLKVGD